MSWLDDNPQIHNIRVATPDLNGQARGKRIPARYASKAEDGGVRLPLSSLNLDMWGEDIEGSPLVFESGDPDGIMRPTERGFVPMPWLDAPSALLPLSAYHEDGAPFGGDARHALANVVRRLETRGLSAVVATELEFYLVDDSGPELQVPPSPGTAKRRIGSEILSLQALDIWDAFFTDLYDGCEAMDIPADTAISEAGPGQFEINLMHQSDPLKAADDAWFFKLLVTGLARKHGFAASFMAKPYAQASGNGMHTHFSLIDGDGNNIFDDGTEQGSDALLHAVAGCLKALPGSGLIFAPHGPSYDRMVPGAHAPTSICWAYENRTAAIRVPGGNPRARRIEHRVAGGDVNPYLSLTAILGAAVNGLEDAEKPVAPITGNAYDISLPQIPTDWDDAIGAFESDHCVKRIFPDELVRNMAMTKRQEMRKLAELDRSEMLALYLDTV